LTDSLNILLDMINNKFNTNFNGILVNRYDNGNDYISAHSDDEGSLSDIGVVSISYGSTRKLRIREKGSKK
jgi:alkylated DNA repair dioxygenase AlkB